MNRAKTFNKLGIAALIAWILGVALLLPLPNHTIRELTSSYNESKDIAKERAKKDSGQQSQKENQRSDYKLHVAIETIWITWWAKALFVAMGILVSVLAVYRLKYWRLMIAGMSTAFILSWIFPYLRSEGSFFELFTSFASAIFRSESIFNYISFFLNEVILPLFHAILIVMLVLYREKGTHTI